MQELTKKPVLVLIFSIVAVVGAWFYNFNDWNEMLTPKGIGTLLVSVGAVTVSSATNSTMGSLRSLGQFSGLMKKK